MKYILILVALILSGCGATPYQSSGLSGGYKDFSLTEENTYQVKFSGNGDLKPDVALDYAMLRSAVITKEKGFKFFEILKHDSKISRTNVGTGAAVIYSYKPNVWMNIKLVAENSLMTNRTHEAELLIKKLTQKYNIKEY